MRRLRLALLIVAALIVFVVISGVLARVFSVDGAERNAITSLVQAEARGNAAAVTHQIQGCGQSPFCRTRALQDASSLTRPGAVSILQLNSSAGFSLSSTLGTARVAWRAGESLPIVQCVRVRRAGNALSGLHVELLEISVRIKSDADCPTRY